MTDGIKTNNTGDYPNYLNLASTGDLFQYSYIKSAEFVDLSASFNTFLLIEEPVKIDKNESTGWNNGKDI